MKTLDIITTGNGYFKAGLLGKVVGAGDRIVFLGSFSNPVETKLPEFTLEIAGPNGSISRREFCQYGRDFRFVGE